MIHRRIITIALISAVVTSVGTLTALPAHAQDYSITVNNVSINNNSYMSYPDFLSVTVHGTADGATETVNPVRVLDSNGNSWYQMGNNTATGNGGDVTIVVSLNGITGQYETERDGDQLTVSATVTESTGRTASTNDATLTCEISPAGYGRCLPEPS